MKLWPVVAVFTTTLLLGCNDKSVQSVEWYMAHDKERVAVLDECKALTLAELAVDENCAHASAAIRRAEDKAKPWINMPMEK